MVVLRLPFGLCVSQDIFQKHMDDITRQVGQGVIGITDDLVVYGTSTEEHDRTLHRLMKVASKCGLVCRAEKCHIRKQSVDFYGMVWSKDGMKPDSKKCDEIRNRPAPRNVQELLSFLGLVQYLSSFIPHLSSKTCVLRQLCKKGVEWNWLAEHQDAFEKLKDAIHEDLELRYFDLTQPVEIEVDALSYGLGAAITQNRKPVVFASKALTPAETCYANIERELHAVVHGLEKFHTYIYGRPVVCYRDHKPLESIQLKQLSQTPPRLQRMLLRIQPYDVTLGYRPGKEMVYADYLSRVAPSPGPEIELEHSVHLIQISNNQSEKVRSASQSDPELSALCEQVIRGWPEQAKIAPKIVRPYWSMRDYITVDNGLFIIHWK